MDFLGFRGLGCRDDSISGLRVLGLGIIRV